MELTIKVAKHIFLKKRTWERLLSEVKSVKGKPAAAIEEARAKKYQTYKPLLYVIKKQVLDGRRQREPRFTPAAVTTFGEFGTWSGMHNGAGVAGRSAQETPGKCWRAT